MRTSFDTRSTLSRSSARSVYDSFASVDHTGGKDASSGYGGPAISALLAMANFHSPAPVAMRVLDYGCGQGKVAELVLSNSTTSKTANIKWRGIDQSPKMIHAARQRLSKFVNDDNSNNRAAAAVSIELLESGDPSDIIPTIEKHSIDRFVSTYCLDLLSEKDMYAVLDLASYALEPNDGLLLLAGITWGYKDSIRTFLMTALWELLYIVARKKVGGCRPQNLELYLKEAGWTVVDRKRTMPAGFPWMVSEVVAARPPPPQLN